MFISQYKDSLYVTFEINKICQIVYILGKSDFRIKAQYQPNIIMSFCKSYNKMHGYWREGHQSCANSPYIDWSLNKKRRPATVVFQYAKHWIDSDMFVYYQPSEQLVSIYLELDYYSFELKATLKINDIDRTIDIDRIHCECFNAWPELNGLPASGCDGRCENRSGGMALYKKNLQDLLPTYDISMEHVATLFFGPDWKVKALPLTRPKLADDTSRDDMRLFFDDYRFGPWARLIGKFVPDEDASAIIIQKCFRGWIARLKYSFNPNTTLGKYYALKKFADGDFGYRPVFVV